MIAAPQAATLATGQAPRGREFPAAGCGGLLGLDPAEQVLAADCVKQGGMVHGQLTGCLRDQLGVLQDLVDLVGSQVADNLASCGAVSASCRLVWLTGLPDPSAGLVMLLVGRRWRHRGTSELRNQLRELDARLK